MVQSRFRGWGFLESFQHCSGSGSCGYRGSGSSSPKSSQSPFLPPLHSSVCLSVSVHVPLLSQLITVSVVFVGFVFFLSLCRVLVLLSVCGCLCAGLCPVLRFLCLSALPVRALLPTSSNTQIGPSAPASSFHLSDKQTSCQFSSHR